jgi:hypothetical protein
LSSRLSLEDRGDSIADDPADVGDRVVGFVSGRQSSLDPDESLLGRLFGQIALVDQQPGRFGPYKHAGCRQQFVVGGIGLVVIVEVPQLRHPVGTDGASMRRR